MNVMKSEMQSVGHVSSEGGPLVLIDAEHLKNWRGIDGKDYARACAVVESEKTTDGGILPLNGKAGLIWSIGGAGTISIVQRDHGSPILVRYWYDEDLTDDSLRGLAARINWDGAKVLGDLEVVSGRLAIIWAVENGSGLKLPNTDGQIRGDTSIEDSGYVISFPVQRASVLFVEGVWSGVQTRALTFKSQ